MLTASSSPGVRDASLRVVRRFYENQWAQEIVCLVEDLNITQSGTYTIHTEFAGLPTLVEEYAVTETVYSDPTKNFSVSKPPTEVL